MKDKLSDEQNEAILQALNKAIDEGPWDASNFLKMLGKNLIGIRDDFLNQLGASTQAQLKAQTHLENQMAKRSNQQEIYVSLYSADGSNLQSWERIVTNLPRQMISRPIYANEDDVKELVRLKENKVNEAYVAIYINKDDILFLSPDKTLMDKRGKPLLSIKDKTLYLENISRFVHLSGVYQWVKGRLEQMP